MKKFFNDYLYSVIKMFVNQFAIAMFGMSLAIATLTAHNMSKSNDFDILTTVVSIFAILFYLFLLYTMTWDIGAKDRISVDCGKKKYRSYTGAILSLLANIPNYILAILYLVAYAFKIEALDMTRLIATLLQGMYMGIITAIKLPSDVQLNASPITFFAITLPAILTCWSAYILGFKNIRLHAIFLPASSKDTKK